MILRLENTTTHQEYQYEVVDVNNGEKLYFRFNINTLDLNDGEYTLKLYEGDELVLSDILKIGDFNSNALQYSKGDNTYIEVKFDAKIQEKEVEISKIDTIVKPDEDFDGMSSVFIDAQPLYDAAYIEGYNEGREDGEAASFDIGFESGVNMQKAKLETISITENGVYEREDGYNSITVEVPDLNGSYDEGYDEGIVDGKEIGYNQGYTAGIEYASENAGEIAAANAIDLVATEFGTYYTKYSDNNDIVYPDLVTGIYPNGENFYDYVILNSRVYNTGIIPTMDTKIEFWHKYTNTDTSDENWRIFIGSAKVKDSENNYQIKKDSGTKAIWHNWGGNTGYKYVDTYGEWNHIIISYLDGFVINGVKINDVGVPKNDGNSPFYINGAEYSVSSNINGYFGMIKITAGGVENVIIPTEDGFKNITTGEMLEMVNDGAYTFVNNNPDTKILDNLIKSVDVQPKIDVGRYGIKFANSTFSEVPPYFNFNNLLDCSFMFQNCGSLQTIPELNTSLVINMKQMFYQSPNLISIPPLIANKITFDNYSGLFYFTTMNKLTDFGGLIGFKGNANNDYTFVRCPNLTYQSCINILNGLYDFTGNGETPTSQQGQLKVHSNFLSLVGDEVSIGTNKGWTITV